jgi:hypothetical protein
MNKKRAEELAMKFVSDLMGRELRMLGVKKSTRHEGKWGVIFERTTKEGHVIDGPMVVIVDERTEEASLFH